MSPLLSTVRKLRVGVRLAASCLVILAAALNGCERIGYYSNSGASGDGDGDGDGADGGPGPVQGSTGTGTVLVTRAQVLESFAACSVDLYGRFDEAASDLSSRASALEADPTQANLVAARDAWKAAMALWQQAELIAVGPAGTTKKPGGRGLRDYVYAWPSVNRCLIDTALVTKSYEADTFSQTALINLRGLATVEYLLFYEGTDNGCAPTSTINAQGSWDALSDAELAARKRRYAAIVAADVADVAERIRSGWTGERGFSELLTGAGKVEEGFASEHEALNAISDGLYFMDLQLKDAKVGHPLGLVDCATATCPEAVESQWARSAREHVRNNLIGFQRVIDGCPAGADVGFDDLLVTAGAADVSADMNARIDAALAAVDSIETPDFIEALGRERADLEALHAALKAITDSLKTDFVTVLDFEPPVVGGSDND